MSAPAPACSPRPPGATPSRRGLPLLLATLGLLAAGGAGAGEPGGPAPASPTGPRDARADPSAPPPEAVVATIPFRPDTAPGAIVLDLAPEGNARRLPLQLDTGATTSVMTPRVARSLGVRVSRLRNRPHRRRTLLGTDLRFRVDTRRSDTAGSTMEFGGVGGDFLAPYVVELDFEARHVRFLDPDRYEVPREAPPRGACVLPIQVVSQRPAVRVTVNGEPLDLLVDTGAFPSLALSGELADRAGVSSVAVEGLRVLGARGPSAARVGRAARVALGACELHEVPTLVLPNGLYNQGFPGDSVVGVDLLSRFLVRIDYPRRRLWLAPSDDPPAPSFDPDALLQRDAANR